jgi:hypothetical protein
VLLAAENIELLFLAVPVTSDSLEAGCPVVQGMGQDPDFSFRKRDELVLEEGIGRHWLTPFITRGKYN